MLTAREILCALVAGILVGGGWWAFMDGVFYAPDVMPWIHILPPVGATVGFIALNVITLDVMTAHAAARVWAFASLTLLGVSIGGAIWITTSEYPADDNWPGVAIIVQALLLLVGAILFFIGRSTHLGREGKMSF